MLNDINGLKGSGKQHSIDTCTALVNVLNGDLLLKIIN